MNKKQILKIINNAVISSYIFSLNPIYALDGTILDISSDHSSVESEDSFIADNNNLNIENDANNNISNNDFLINDNTDYVNNELIVEDISSKDIIEDANMSLSYNADNIQSTDISQENINLEEDKIIDTEEIRSVYEVNWVTEEVANIKGKLIEDLTDEDFQSIVSFSLSGSGLSGEIPSEFYKMTNLKWIDLSNNNLTGSIAKIIESCPNLIDLKLSNNNFSGEIPSSIGNLTALKWFNVINNNLSGTIPSSIGNLTSLTQFVAGNNNLLGIIPSEIGNLVSLTELDLEYNNLSGTIPSSIGNIESLKWLKLNDNQLTGSLDSNLSNLTNLISFTVKNNNLSGTISKDFAKLTNIKWFILSYNQFTGVIPEEVKNMSSDNDYRYNLFENEYNQKQLYFKDEENISINIGERIDIDNLKEKVYIKWSNNTEEIVDNYDVTAVLDEEFFNGTVATKVGETSLKAKISIANDSNTSATTANKISISILDDSILDNWVNAEVARMSGKTIQSLTEEDYLSITNFNLSSSSLSGNIPEDFYRLKNLKWINLSDNNLTGDIARIISEFPNLITLNLSNNDFEGEIPSSIKSITNLSWLVLSNNRISGELPEEIFTLPKLIQFLIRNNNITGTISSNIGNLTTLTELDLSENNLTGNIPKEIGNLTEVEWLNLNDNNLTGSIPKELGNMINLKSVNLKNNKLSGQLPVELSNLKNVLWITLSNNQLIGTIPDEIKNMSSVNNYQYNLFENEHSQKEISIKDTSSITILLGETISHSNLNSNIEVVWNNNRENLLDDYVVEIKKDESYWNDANEAINIGTTSIKYGISGYNIQSVNEINITINDNIYPILNLCTANNEWTNNMVEISVEAYDNHKIKKVVLPDGGESLTGDFKYEVYKNGTYEFIVIDEFGNKTSNSISITNIDKTEPTINVEYDTKKTNNNVIVSVSGIDNESGVKSIKLPDGTMVENDSANFIAEKNGDYIIEITDNAGNVSSSIISIKNIDKTSPTIIAETSINNWTNKNVDIKIDVIDDNSISKIILPDGSTTRNSNFIYNVKSNGLYKFQAIDDVNNVSTISVNINNIDKIKPSLSVSKSKLNNDNSVDVSIDAKDFESGIKEIYLDNGLVVDLNNPIINITSNGIYKVYALDYAGNLSEQSFTINNIVDLSDIDATAPTITYSLSNYNVTNEDIIINVIASDNKDIKEIICPDGSSVSSNTIVYTVSSNGNYTFKAIDTSNNTTEITIPINNIDKTEVEVTISKSRLLADNTIDLTFNVNKNSEYIDLIKTSENIHIDTDNPVFNVDKNGTYKFYIEDKANNKTIATTTINDIPFDGADNEVPEVNYLLNEYGWTNKSVEISVHALDNHGIKSITMPDGTVVENSFVTYMVSENGEYVFKATDISGNTNSINVVINNIDKEKPLIDTLNIEYNEDNFAVIDIKTNDLESGIKSVILPNGIYTINSESTVELEVGNTYNMTISDIAGNTDIVTFTVDNKNNEYEDDTENDDNINSDNTVENNGNTNEEEDLDNNYANQYNNQSNNFSNSNSKKPNGNDYKNSSNDVTNISEKYDTSDIYYEEINSIKEEEINEIKKPNKNSESSESTEINNLDDNGKKTINNLYKYILLVVLIAIFIYLYNINKSNKN